MIKDGRRIELTKNSLESSDAPPSKALSVAIKLELDESSGESPCFLQKRSKPSDYNELKCGKSRESEALQAVQYHNLLHEPSPLGLRLRKSPSLLNLIEMRLSQANSTPASCVANVEPCVLGKRKDTKAGCAGHPNTSDKLKASNFPATLLRIGNWEFISKYEGDLVAKFYFAKQKLVWEVLQDGLKSKIEIQWSDVCAVKATSPDDGPSALDIVLSRQPLFFRETNPQPRKHTLWQATADFTNGQASVSRKHFLMCPQGLLSKHFEKLIQCYPRLNSLSRETDMILDSLHFNSEDSFFKNNEGKNCRELDCRKEHHGPSLSEFHDSDSLTTGPSASSDIEVSSNATPEDLMGRRTSPFSVPKHLAIQDDMLCEAKVLECHTSQGHFEALGPNPSFPETHFLGGTGNYTDEQAKPIYITRPEDGFTNRDAVLEELTQRLLSDAHFSNALDEQRLMSRVNSLRCLLQKDTVSSRNPEADAKEPDKWLMRDEEEPLDTLKQEPGGISRKESYGDLLLHLPRIASLPHFLFKLSEDTEHGAR